jgi:hypothetical protein
VEFGPDGKPLGIRACGFCNVVTNHNYRTCPHRTDAIVNKQKLQKQIGAAQVSTNGDDTRNSYTCRKCGGTDGHNARTCKVGKEVSGAEQKQGKVQSSKKSKEEDEEEEFDENDDQSDEDNEDDSIGDEETETDDEAAKAQPEKGAGKAQHSGPVRRSSRLKNP